MAEIRNYTMKFGFGRAATPRLTCWRKLAYAEIHGDLTVSAAATH